LGTYAHQAVDGIHVTSDVIPAWPAPASPTDGGERGTQKPQHSRDNTGMSAAIQILSIVAFSLLVTVAA